MLAVAALAIILRLPCSPSRVLAAAAAIVVAIDPWATLSVGYWLSFGAVVALMAAGSAFAQGVGQARSAAKPSDEVVPVKLAQRVLTRLVA